MSSLRPHERILLTVVLVGHAVGAALWWWGMPGGFEVGHPRFWLNGVFPWIALIVAGVALTGVAEKRAAFLRCGWFFVGFWLFGATAAGFVFPQSFSHFSVLLLPGLLVVAGIPMCLREWRPTCALGLCSVVLGASLGVVSPFALKAPAPDTSPINESWPEIQGAELIGVTNLSEGVTVDSSAGTVAVSAGDLTVRVKPLMDFQDRSPDGCWTIFAPAYRERERRLAGAVMLPGLVRARYDGSIAGSIETRAPSGGGLAEVTAWSELAEEVYSHLSVFCYLEITGHRRLWLSFSPTGEERVEVLPFDYPVGRPARMGYLSKTGQFHVVEGRSGEKGPFRDLIPPGSLDGAGAVTITLFNETNAVMRITLDDWARQCGRQASPTAGWGFPVNSIQFMRYGEWPAAPVIIYVSLASTSVGRGWDSVGHRAGVYRNRIRFEALFR